MTESPSVPDRRPRLRRGLAAVVAAVVATTGLLGVSGASTDAAAPPVRLLGFSGASTDAVAPPVRLLGVIGASTDAVAPPVPVHPAWTLGGPRPHPESARPADVAVAAENIFVLDRVERRVVVHAKDGAVSTTWGGFGYRPGELYLPTHIAAGANGSVYVTDRRPGRPGHWIWRFDAQGRLLGGWPSDLPIVAVTADGHPIRLGRHEVQPLTAEGDPLPSWPIPFDPPFSLSASRHGLLFVGGRSVGLYGTAGRFLQGWSTHPIEGRVFAGAVAGDDVWLLEHADGTTLHRFSVDGVQVALYEGPSSPPDQALGLEDGTLLLVSRSEGITRFSSRMERLSAFGAADSPPDELGAVSVSPNGRVAILRPNRNAATVHDQHGRRLAEVGLSPASLDAVYGIELDATGHLWVAGVGNQLDAGGSTVGHGPTLIRLDPDTGAASGPIPTQLFDREGAEFSVDTNARGDVLIAHSADRHITLVRADGSIRAWPIPHPAPGTGLAARRRIRHTAGTPAEPVGYRIDARLGADGSVFVVDQCCRGGSEDVQAAGFDGRSRPLAIATWNPSDRPDSVGLRGTHADPALGPSTHLKLPPQRLRRYDADGAMLLDVSLAAHVDDPSATLNVAPLTHGDGTLGGVIVTVWTYDAPTRALVFDVLGDRVSDAVLPGTYRASDAEYGGGLLTVRDGLATSETPPRIRTYETRPAAEWRAQYAADPFFASEPQAAAHLATGANLILDWGSEPPLPDMPADGWAVRLTKVLTSEPGMRRLHVRAFGGMRMWLGSQLVIDAWNASYVEVDRPVFLPGPSVPAEIQFRDPSGPAALELSLLPTGHPGFRVFVPATMASRPGASAIGADASLPIDWGHD